MIETADVVVVGAGVQGASLAFHLARRGASVVVVERETGGGGRHRPVIRLRPDALRPRERDAARLAVVPVFPRMGGARRGGRPGLRADRVPARDAGSARGDRCAPTSPWSRGSGSRSRPSSPAEIARLVPGAVTDGLAVGAYEPESGYADPSGTAAGFLAAARRLGARLVQGSRVPLDRGRGRRGQRRRHRSRARSPPRSSPSRSAPGRRTSPGPPASSCPSSPGATRRPTSGCRPATDRTSRSSSTRSTGSTSGPRAATSCSSGWRAATRWAARRTGRSTTAAPATIEDMVRRLCARVPWMTDGHVPHGPRRPGRDHARPARRSSGAPARTAVRRVRVLRHRLQDGPGHRRLPGRADPRRPHDDRRHLGLRPRPVRGGPPARRRALVRGALALSRGRGQRDQRRRPLARSAAGAGPGSAR